MEKKQTVNSVINVLKGLKTRLKIIQTILIYVQKCTLTNVYICICNKSHKHANSDYFFFFFCLFLEGAAHMAYGVSQARCAITAIAAGLCHSHMRNLSHVCDLYHSPRQCQILNSLSEVRD